MGGAACGLQERETCPRPEDGYYRKLYSICEVRICTSPACMRVKVARTSKEDECRPVAQYVTVLPLAHFGLGCTHTAHVNLHI